MSEQVETPYACRVLNFTLRRQTVRLLDGGTSIRETARLVGVSKSTVVLLVKERRAYKKTWGKEPDWAQVPPKPKCDAAEMTLAEFVARKNSQRTKQRYRELYGDAKPPETSGDTGMRPAEPETANDSDPVPTPAQ